MGLLRSFLRIFSVLIFAWALMTTGSLASDENITSVPPSTGSLNVINYNLWHGLGQGIFKRKEIDPPNHKKQRFQTQLKELEEARPDILFLQELNPVSSLSKKIAQKLGMFGIYHVTNCGTSVLGLGIPTNLSMGIAILVRPPFQIKKIKGFKLSGPFGFCHNPLFTFQYDEFRYGLFAMASHPDYGSMLLVNTHFHHGVEWSPQVREKLNTWESNEVLTSAQRVEIEETIDDSNLRRMQELQNLFNKVEQLQKDNPLPLILAGDFNSTVHSLIYEEIIETYQLRDTMSTYFPRPYTWDPLKNKKNHQYTSLFDFSVPTFDIKEVQGFFRKYNGRPRRIDYIFLSSQFEVISSALFGHKPSPDGIIGSDHFGVISNLHLKK